jgi:phage gp29-like protein
MAWATWALPAISTRLWEAETMADSDKAVTPPAGEMASIAIDPAIQGWGNFVLQPQDPVIIARGMGKGVQLYEELLADPHIHGLLQKRMRAVVGREWEVEEASDRPEDRAAAEFVREALPYMRYDQGTMAGLTAIVTGFSVQELLWNPVTIDGRGWVLPTRILYKRPGRFVFTKDRELRLLTRQAMMDGVPVPDRKFVVVRNNAHLTEDPYGLGVGHALWWYAFFKRKGMAWWLIHAEKFASPTPMTKYPPNSDQAQINAALAAARKIALEAAVAIPSGMELELLEAKRSGDAGYQKLLDYFDRMASIAILGETLTTHIGDTGSKAAASVHNDVREDICDADCDLLAEAHNATLFRWIIEANMPGAEPPKVWRRKPVEQDLEAQLRIDTGLDRLGWEITDEHVHETYGEGYRRKTAPDPGPDDPSLTEDDAGDDAETTPPPVELAAPAPDRVDDLSEQAIDLAEASTGDLLEETRAAIFAAGSFEEASQLLLMIAASPRPDMARVIGEARITADLAGAADLDDQDEGA